MDLSLNMLAAVEGRLAIVDVLILVAYFAVLIGLGIYTSRKIVSSEEFMVAGRRIPGWAAGLSVMCAYTSSLSYIATPGQSFGSNWHPALFAYSMIPVALFVSSFIIAYYRKIGLISVYEFLERRLGVWARVYAAITFMLYMIGRIAAILYLTALLFGQFAHVHPNVTYNIIIMILIIGVITLIYTLLGGMEAIIWADVLQAVIMLSGIAVCCAILTYKIVQGPEPAIASAWEAGKFSLGKLKLSLAHQGNLANRTIWVMIIFGITENLRNLMADQNYVQKYTSCANEKEAKRSIWVATIIYAIMTTTFVYIGTALWAYYHNTGILEGAKITKQDDVFPFYIATELFTGFRGLLIAAILAAAISTIATAINCTATIWLQDFHKKYISRNITDKQSIVVLRLVTVIWGILGIIFATLMIRAKSVLDVWWQISGIFGGGTVGLFILSLMRARLRMWQGIVAIVASLLFIFWGSFIRQEDPIHVVGLLKGVLSETSVDSILCGLDKIIVGALGAGVLIAVALLLGLTNRGGALPQGISEGQEDA
ncbi:MAG: sodium:solute symporter family transporter [Planctomycetota bacterium]|jgi:SSS family solute:Na+ symporter